MTARTFLQECGTVIIAGGIVVLLYSYSKNNFREPAADNRRACESFCKSTQVDSMAVANQGYYCRCGLPKGFDDGY